jgi:hypothetical protein
MKIMEEWRCSSTNLHLGTRLNLGTTCIRGCVGATVGLEIMEKRKSLTLSGIELLLFGHPARRLFTISTELSRL